MFSSPTVVGETVFVGSCKGVLYALDRTDGGIVWQLDVTNGGDPVNFHGDPLFADGTLYIGTDGTGGGFLYAVEPVAGDVMWMYPDSSGIATDILTRKNRLYATTLDDVLICLERDTGTPVWQYSGGYESGESSFNGTPALVGGTIVFGGLDGRLRALDAVSGDFLWVLAIGDRIKTSVLSLGQHVFAGTTDGNLYRIEATSGDISAQISVGKSLSQTIRPVDGGLAVFLDWAQDTSEIAVVDTALAGIRWRHAPPQGDKWTSARPYIDGNNVVVGSKEGWVQAFRATGGELAWQFQVDGTVRGMGFADDIILVGTLSGMVYCLDQTDIH